MLKKNNVTTKTLNVMLQVRVLHQLEFVEELLGEGRRKRVAVILTGGDEAVDQRADGLYVRESRLIIDFCSDFSVLEGVICTLRNLPCSRNVFATFTRSVSPRCYHV